MAKETDGRVVAGTASLPFIQQRSTRRGPTSEYNRSGSSPDVLSSELTETPRFLLRELSGRPVLDWPIRLPERDPRGVASGDGFQSWKRARDGKTGISGTWHSVKSNPMQPCHSLLEAKLRAFFDMCPFVLECRTQYPSWDPDEYKRYYLDGKRFPKNKVMSIDFMLTLSVPGRAGLVYHGVSGKPSKDICGAKTIRRHRREAEAISKWGASHEVMHETTVSDVEYRNYLLLKSWFLWTDVTASMQSAQLLGSAIGRSKAWGPLDKVLPAIGKRLGFTRDDSYRFFAVAIFLGYLWLDHRFPLRITEPLVLMPLPA